MDSGDEPLPMMTTSTLGLDYFWTPIMAYFSAPIDIFGLCALDMTPLKIRRLKLSRPSGEDVDWLRRTLDRESAPFGTHVALAAGGRLAVS